MIYQRCYDTVHNTYLYISYLFSFFEEGKAGREGRKGRMCSSRFGRRSLRRTVGRASKAVRRRHVVPL